jgi:uncharacterized protein
MVTWISTSRDRQAARSKTRGNHRRTTGTGPGQGPGKATRALVLLQLALPLLLSAQGTGVERLFPERPTNYLTDVAGIVGADEAAEINDLAARLRTATGAELAVVTLPTIEDRSPNEVATAIGRRWGVGAAGEIGDSARNAGMVLLLVPRTPEHKGEVYLATGRGIEGILTDAIAGRILDLMLPELRAQRWGPALVLGTRAIAATVAKGYGVSDSALLAADPFRGRSGGEAPGLPPILVILIIIAIMIAISSASGGGGGGRGRRRRRRGSTIIWGGPGLGGGWGSGGWGGGGWGGGGGGGFGGFGGGGGFSGGGAGRSF